MAAASSTDALFTLNSNFSQIPHSHRQNVKHPADSRPTTDASISGSAVTGVCFLRGRLQSSHHLSHGRDLGEQYREESCDGENIDDGNSSISHEENSSEDDSDSCSSSSPIQFQCTNLLLGPKKVARGSHECNAPQPSSSYQQAAQISAASHSSLSGEILASCHQDGSVKLWDLATRRCVVEDIRRSTVGGYRDGVNSGYWSDRIGSGLAIRRIGKKCHFTGSISTTTQNDPTPASTSYQRFLYQTRDPKGTISVHDLQQPSTPIVKMYTHSIGFCAMAPCHGNEHLVALPCLEQSMAVVRDLRCDPMGSPASKVLIGEGCLGVYANSNTNGGGNLFGSNVVEDEGAETMENAGGIGAAIQEWDQHNDNQSDQGIFDNDYSTSTESYDGLGRHKTYGMLTSLALCQQQPTQRIVLGCGMEDGSVVYHDLGMSSCRGSSHAEGWSHGKKFNGSASGKSGRVCSVKVGKDPVLCLDMVSPSSTSGANTPATGFENGGNKKSKERKITLAAISGCAGDADDADNLPEKDKGTVAAMTVSLAVDISNQNDVQSQCDTNEKQSISMKATIRSKTTTCSSASGGKIGVNTCRFRPDGRIFAVGGWDYRLRIFGRALEKRQGRTSSKLLAILRGHDVSVTAMDWAEDAAVSGLLATGASDGKICFWRVFPHTLKE